MYDHSFGIFNFQKVMRRSDFINIPEVEQLAYKIAALERAMMMSFTFFEGENILKSFHLKKKNAYKAQDFSCELVLRKVARNIEELNPNKPPNRDFIISNVCRILEEGVPCRVYRLDVKSFYESFLDDFTWNLIESSIELNLQTKKLYKKTMLDFKNIGGVGLPRGLKLSAVVSELAMVGFDHSVWNKENVYFYVRYVDDIFIVTSGYENPTMFLDFINKTLPKGLTLNENKQKIIDVPSKAVVTVNDKIVFKVNYLGYNFTVYDPKNNQKNLYRNVRVNISDDKIVRFKKRIIKCLLDFCGSNDFELLLDRVKFLSSNFSIYDKKRMKKKLAGIYYGYPRLSIDSESLEELDLFLRRAILSNHGRVFRMLSTKLTHKQKRLILACSFCRGFQDKKFVYFSAPRISEIQECWLYE